MRLERKGVLTQVKKNRDTHPQHLPHVTPTLFSLSAFSPKMQLPGRQTQGPSALHLGLVECLAHSGGSVSPQRGRAQGGVRKMWELHVC